METENGNKVVNILNSISEKDVKFYVADQYDTTSVRKPGDLSVIFNKVDENTYDTSIWLKDVHIASGYGFDSKKDKDSIKELLDNPNIQKLINNDILPDSEKETEEDEQIEIQNSEVYIDNKKIKFKDGILKGNSWIDVKDLKFGTTDGLSIKYNEEIILPVYDSLNLDSVEFKYTYTTENEEAEDLKYIVYISDYDNLNESTFLSLTNYIDIPNNSINATGILSSFRLDNLGKEIKKSYFDNRHFIESKYVYFVIKDSRNTKILYKIGFKVTFKFPIFKLDSYDSSTFDELSLNEYDGLNLYKNSNKIELRFEGIVSAESGESSKHYIAIPTPIAEKVKIILKQSNISGNFIKKFQGKIDGYDYTVFESKHNYYGIVTWIVEIEEIDQD